MIRLKHILKEEVDPMQIAQPFISHFASEFKTKPKFKYLGLKNNEYVFTADVEDLGNLHLIFSEAKYMLRVTEKYAYVGIIYTLNGLEQFDATVCYIQRKDNKFSTKLFDDSDPDFSNAKTNFIKLIKIMV